MNLLIIFSMNRSIIGVFFCFLLRCLHSDRSLLVRWQSHSRILRPAAWRSQVRHAHTSSTVCVWLPAANAVCTAAGMSWALVCIWAGQRPVWPYWEDLCSAAPAGSLPPLHGKPTAPHKEATCSTGFCPQGELWATLILWTTAKENTGLLKKILVTHFGFLILFFFYLKTI